MPRIIKTKTLTSLRKRAASAASSAADAQQAQREAEECRRLAEAAELRAAQADERARAAEARRDAIERDALYRATSAIQLTSDPDRGEQVRGMLALRLTRHGIAATNEHGSAAEKDAVRIFDILLCGPAAEPQAAVAAAADREPQ